MGVEFDLKSCNQFWIAFTFRKLFKMKRFFGSSTSLTKPRWWSSQSNMGSGDLLAKQVDGDVAPQVALQPGQGQVLRGADEPDRLPLPAPLLHLPRLHRPRGLQRHRQGGQDHPSDQGHQRLRLRLWKRRIYEKIEIWWKYNFKSSERILRLCGFWESTSFSVILRGFKHCCTRSSRPTRSWGFFSSL